MSITNNNGYGRGQTRQDKKASRSKSVTYYNTGKDAIQVSVSTLSTALGSTTLYGYVDGVTVAGSTVYGSGSGYCASITFDVPSGSGYMVDGSGSGGSNINVWSEQRA